MAGRGWPELVYRLPEFFAREGLYRNDGDEHRRFLLLSQAAVELCRRRGWAPDIVHANDWHTGLMPLYLRSIYRKSSLFSGARLVFTIHNLGYQGGFGAESPTTSHSGAADTCCTRTTCGPGRVSFMEHALMYADAITTVSPTYADEIQTPSTASASTLSYGNGPRSHRDSKRHRYRHLESQHRPPIRPDFSATDLAVKRPTGKRCSSEAGSEPELGDV